MWSPIFVMGSNLGGLAGQQLFTEGDAPRYRRAFLAILMLYAGPTGITAGATGRHWRGNKRPVGEYGGEGNGLVRDGDEEDEKTASVSALGGGKKNYRQRKKTPACLKVLETGATYTTSFALAAILFATQH